METQGIAGKLDFPRRKRGVDAVVGKAQKAGADAALPVQAPAAAPAAKKRRVAKQPTMKQAFSAAVAASGAAQVHRGGKAAAQLLGRGAEVEAAPADAAHARAGGDDAERLSAGGAEAPQTQAQAEEPHAAPIASPARAAAAPLAAARAAAAAGPIVFEHEAVDTSDDDDGDADCDEPSALAELAARVNALKRAMAGCERVRLACVAGSAKARAAARQRDALGTQIAALARVFTPDGMSDDEEAEHAPTAAHMSC